jgi:hypothetical protein
MKLRLTDHGLRQLREISRGGNPPMTGLLRQLKLVDAKGKLTPAGKEALGPVTNREKPPKSVREPA